jgi:uncharacterized protein (TIGR04255 family)
MIPAKLKDDSIMEAIAEVRFDFPPGELEEVVLGRLLDFPEWSSMTIKERLAAAEVPHGIRQSDVSFKFQPHIELRNPKANYSARLGPNVVALHFKAPYPGWNELFFPTVQMAVKAVCHTIKTATVKRLGLRYVNTLTSSRHHLSQLFDLEVSLTVKGKKVKEPVFINYLTEKNDLKVATRIVSPSLVMVPLPEKTTAVIDVDVSHEPQSVWNEEQIVSWFDRAHTAEKEEFFGLIPSSVTEKLAER